MSQVWDLEGLPATDKLIMLAFADHANDDGGLCYPSQGSIARKTGLHVDTVQRRVAVLTETGLLRKVERLSRKDGTFGAWLTQVCPQGVGKPVDGGGGDPAHDRGGTPHTTGYPPAHDREVPRTESEQEPSLNHQRTARNERKLSTSHSRSANGSVRELRDYDVEPPDAFEIAAMWGILEDHSGTIPDHVQKRLARILTPDHPSTGITDDHSHQSDDHEQDDST
jgi:Helix-turn-helix domain